MSIWPREEEISMTRHLKFDDYMREELADFEYAQGFLTVALEESERDGDYGAFLQAVRRVAEIHGISKIAQESSVSRSNLYKAFAQDGNPSLETLVAVLRSLGLRLSIAPLEPAR